MFERLFGSGTTSTLVDAAFEDVSTMLQEASGMLKYSLAAFLENKKLEVDLDGLDDRVDEGERMVRRTILEHLSFNPRQDLVASLVLVSMVHDAERTADFARGLAELAELAKSPREGPFAEELRSLADRLLPLFDLCEEAFRGDDPALADQVISAQQQLRNEFLGYKAKVADSDLSPDMALAYAGAAQILRRVAAHLSNIASSVVQPYDRIRHLDEDV